MASSEQAEQPSQVRGVGLPSSGGGDPRWSGGGGLAGGWEPGGDPEPRKQAPATSSHLRGPAPRQVLAARPLPR